MDAITDLTEQAVSFLILARDICQATMDDPPAKDAYKGLSRMDQILPKVKADNLVFRTCYGIRERICENVWSSAERKKERPTKKLFKEDLKIMKAKTIMWAKGVEAQNTDLYNTRLESSYLESACQLLKWLHDQQDWLLKSAPSLFENLAEDHYLSLKAVPSDWRKLIRLVFYQKPVERLNVANVLRYMPAQVIWCFDTDLNLYNQRLFQFWPPPIFAEIPGGGQSPAAGSQFEDDIPDPPFTKAQASADLLSKKDIGRHKAWWSVKTSSDAKPRWYLAARLLIKDQDRLEKLQMVAPLPFESIFKQELDEIQKSREIRSPNKKAPVDKETQNAPGFSADPIAKAREMNLWGLAFSGGGIRSATFNLGVLQKLAVMGILNKIDYLSTVSGGGYIGSWYLSWIKRAGSLDKVEDRLSPLKSPDPMAEDARPIRWLRMYSNYLSPDASIMSADAWTMGITWLRNTLINQVILLLLLCTVLSGIHLVFQGWQSLVKLPSNFNALHVFLWSFVIIIPSALIAGLGMYIYDPQSVPQSWLNLGRNRYLPVISIGIIALGGLGISAWMYTPAPTNLPAAFMDKVGSLWPAGINGLIGMICIAWIGKYHRQKDEIEYEKLVLILFVCISSVIAVIGCQFLLGGFWNLLTHLFEMPEWFEPYVQGVDNISDKSVFIIGLPVTFELISCCVVIRMMLMGNKFPDERREWWGRMGALTHRFSLLWVVVTFSALILPEIAHAVFHKTWQLALAYTGWLAIIGKAVKMAYESSSAPADKKKPGFSVSEAFIRFAPYLFMIGFLLTGAYLLNCLNLVGHPQVTDEHNLVQCIIITLILGLVTLLLSWRVGVNEFSLHHFYRNRLVRAYLGATRRRTDRSNTANNFTGFDCQDDIKLADFSNAPRHKLTVVDGECYEITEIIKYGGPFPLVNTALNATVVSELDRQDRKAESFVFSPLYCGYDFSRTRSASYSTSKAFDYGYRPTRKYAYKGGGPTLGTAMAISGAAVNPNMGFHSSPATAFLLTIFNVRLGWWIGNPGSKEWRRSNPASGLVYLIYDLIGKSNVDSDYVCLSDGGHFDNMGLYELVRRGCKNIILGDGEEDPKAICEGLANAVRRCRIDFGAEIDIDTSPITDKDEKTGFSKAHIVKGTIRFSGEEKASGTLWYIKASVTGHESVDIREYFMNNKEFPDQPTSDQFFDESQFESYRKLGYSVYKDKIDEQLDFTSA